MDINLQLVRFNDNHWMRKFHGGVEGGRVAVGSLIDVVSKKY